MKTSKIQTSYLPIHGLHFTDHNDMLISLEDGSHYRISIKQDINSTHHSSYDIVTAAENYDYAIEQFVKYPKKELTDIINVLVVYFEADKLLYHAIAVQVNLAKVENTVDTVLSNSRRIQSFQMWSNPD